MSTTGRARVKTAGAAKTPRKRGGEKTAKTTEANPDSVPSTAKKAQTKTPKATTKLGARGEPARARKRAARHLLLLEHERQLWSSGHLLVAGLDEAGAGPLAGPVVAACVVLDPDRTDALVGVDDSKRLTAAEREALALRIKTNVRAYAVASASVREIDEINILQAALLAMRRAYEAVAAELGALDHLLIDARRLSLEIPQTPLIKGDSRSLSIAAASILAKTERDAWMTAAAEQFPRHGFERHKGYGTKEHLDALQAHGVTPLHRRTFEPIATMLAQLSLFD